MYVLGHYLEKDMRDSSKSFVPTNDDFKSIAPGNTVEVIFESENHQREILAVKITGVNTSEEPWSFSGVVSSNPQVLTSPTQGEVVTFGTNHISNIYPQ